MQSTSRPRYLIRFTIGAVAAMLALGAAACGGDDEEEEATVATTTATGATGAQATQTIKLSETDFELSPANPTVKPGTVTIEVSNDGQTAHNIEVEGPAGEAELPENLQPGESDELEVDLSEPGKYTWYCPVANHRELGMEGEITVK